MGQKLWLGAVIVAVALIVAVKTGRSTSPASSGCCPELALAPERTSSGQAVLPPVGKPAYVLVHSTMCIPCKQMDKTAKAVVPRFRGKVQYLDVLIDRPQDSALVKRLKVSLIPTSVFLGSDGKELGRVVGVIKPDDLTKRLQALAGEN